MKDTARKVLETIDQGLTRGVGVPIPGSMCIEAAVCYAMGLPHGDNPTCVSPVLRTLKIGLNDKRWSSPQARARGLRRLGIAQLGSKGALDEEYFADRVLATTIKNRVVEALSVCAERELDPDLQAQMLAAAAWIRKCHPARAYVVLDRLPRSVNAQFALCSANASLATVRSSDPYMKVYHAVTAASSVAAYLANDPNAGVIRARYDEGLAAFAEDVVQILIEMKAPGCQWLCLTEEAQENVPC